MRPYISVIYEHNNKQHALPIPSKYRELLDCVHALGLKDADDEDDMRVIGYKSLYVPVPDSSDLLFHVTEVATELSKLTEAQVMAIGSLCHASALTFGDIKDILVRIYPNLREVYHHENS